MKKLFLAVLLISLFVSVCIFSSSAEDMVVAEGKCGDNITWKIYDKSAMAQINYHLVFEGTGTLNSYKKDGSLCTYATRNESQFADYKDMITSLKVCDGITAIGNYGLAFLPALQRAEIANSVTSLGGGALETNSSLYSFYREGNIARAGLDLEGYTSIGSYCFDGCGAISRITLDPSFSGTLETEVFKNTSISLIIIPEGVTKIKTDAFESCNNLTYVQFLGDPAIEENAFVGCGIRYVYGKSGSSAEAFAESIDAEFSTEEMSENIVASKDAIAYGTCGDEVFWQILNEGTNDAPSYIFDVFGSGTTMLALNASGEEITYNNQNELLWNSFVPYIKKARVGGEVDTLGNCALAFLKQVEYIELSPKVIHFRDKVFESNAKMRAIYITGNEPSEGVADLSNILSHGSYQFDGCRKITNVIFCENMNPQDMKTEFLKSTGIVEFTVPNQFKRISIDAFEGCSSLTTLKFFGDPVIVPGALSWCKKLTKIYGISGGNVEAYAKENGIEFISPLNITVYCDGEIIAEIGAVEGSTYENPVIDGTVYMLYTDETMTKPYIMSTKITEDITLYASPLLSHVGFMVRSEGYHGLRSIYDFSFDEIKGNSEYDVIELGAFASKQRGVRIIDLRKDMNYIYSTVIVSENTLVGKVIGVPQNSRARFAYTAVGFEVDGAISSERAAETMNLRGYVILEEKSSGRQYLFHTDTNSANLIDKCKSTLSSSEAEKLTEENVAFIENAASVTPKERRVYSKDELMAALSKIYSEREGFIVGQHCGFSDADSFASFVEEFYNESGDIPGVIALDQGTMNLSGALTEEAREILTSDLIEYAKMGGVFSLSFHMDHPANAALYCRGELGGEAVWDELMTEGTALNDALMASLETARRTLQDLEDAGVPVLFRPLHEMNGGWFWWCIIQTVDGETRALDAEYFVRLWKYFYNYFEVECDLDNLIWVYSPNFTNSKTSPVPTMYCYPGDEYVDMVGCDWYTGLATLSDIEGAGKSYSSVAATGKPAAMTEFGLRNSLASPSPIIQERIYSCMNELETYKSILDSGLGVTYVLNWDGQSSAYKNLGRVKEFMSAPETFGAADVLAILQGVDK